MAAMTPSASYAAQTSSAEASSPPSIQSGDPTAAGGALVALGVVVFAIIAWIVLRFTKAPAPSLERTRRHASDNIHLNAGENGQATEENEWINYEGQPVALGLQTLPRKRHDVEQAQAAALGDGFAIHLSDCVAELPANKPGTRDEAAANTAKLPPIEYKHHTYLGESWQNDHSSHSRSNSQSTSATPLGPRRPERTQSKNIIARGGDREGLIRAMTAVATRGELFNRCITEDRRTFALYQLSPEASATQPISWEQHCQYDQSPAGPRSSCRPEEGNTRAV